MSDNNSSTDTLLGFCIIIGIFALGFWLGTVLERKDSQHAALELGVAQYNHNTSKFEFKTNLVERH